MTKKLSIEDLRDLLIVYEFYIGIKIKHIKSNSYYKVCDILFKEEDMSIWFSYKTLHKKPIKFIRPISELLNGRFSY